MVRITWIPFVLVTLLVFGSVSWAGDDAPPGEHPQEIPDEIVIGFHGPIPAVLDDWVERWDATLLVRNEALAFVSVRVLDAESADTVIADALERPEVRYAQRDGIVETQFLPPRDPVDQQYPSQWGYPAISAPEAWAWQRGNLLPKVSILDTGIEITHEDLALHSCGPFESFVPGEPDIMDQHGHGTHVAGTVAAVSDNVLGVSGTSQSCLMGAKVLNRFGSGQWTWVADGITWSVDNGADIISMSLGGGGGHPALEDAVVYAETNDVLVVAAAGNSGCWVSDTVLYPAKYEEVLAVASLAAPGNVLSGFSSCGPAVEISAPGSNILSTWRGNDYRSISGTSMATPHVSGVAALIKSQWHDVGGEQMRCVLTATADDLGDPGRDPLFGYGRVNAYEAVTLAGEPQLGLPILTDPAVAQACGIDVPFPWG